MDRRKSLKVLALGGVSAGVLLDACKTEDKKTQPAGAAGKNGNAKKPAGRMAEEFEHNEKVLAETFFTPHEMATITVLADIIIPKDDISGSASDAGVPAFIEYIVKDKPEFKTPMRGGLQWIDQQCYRKYNKPFEKCNAKQQLELVDQIAYPKKAGPEMQQGASFFSLMRNLTASGFYTSEIGVKDVGYAGNQPNMWNGVPDDVLKQYNLAYTDQEMQECAKY